jgi:hypothetical protein
MARNHHLGVPELINRLEHGISLEDENVSKHRSLFLSSQSDEDNPIRLYTYETPPILVTLHMTGSAMAICEAIMSTQST